MIHLAFVNNFECLRFGEKEITSILISMFYDAQYVLSFLPNNIMIKITKK